MMKRLLHPLALAAILLSQLACPGPPDAACVQYVACQTAYDAEFGIDPPVDTSAYDEGGECWVNVSVSEQCADTCLRALDALSAAATQAGADLTACE
jgi:hypothetical protein